MKNGWPQKKLADVIFDIKDGGTPSRKNPEYFGGDVYWCVVKDIKPLIFDTAEKLTRTGLNNCSAKVWPIGSIIISLGATIGQIGIAKVPTATKQGLAGIVVNQQQMTPEFLAYGLLEQREYIQSIATGTTIREIRPTRFAETINLLVPPLPEQHRIVGILDEAFKGIANAEANAEKNLRNAAALFESHVHFIFAHHSGEWTERRLDALAKFSQGIQVGLSDQANSPKKGLARFIRIIDYTQGTDDIRYVEDPGARYWVDKSDIVMVRYGTPGLVGRGIEGVIANNLFKISVLDGSVSNDFLAYCLRQKAVQKYLANQGSSTMPALTFKQLGEVIISFPRELEKQNTIVALLDSLHSETQRLAGLYERKLSALGALKKSLLHQAFTGQL